MIINRIVSQSNLILVIMIPIWLWAGLPSALADQAVTIPVNTLVHCPPAPPSSTANEHQVRNAICHGRFVDLTNSSFTHRSISGTWLSTILTNPHFTQHITHRGVTLQGAILTDMLNLEDATLSVPLRIEFTTFQNPPQLNNLKTTHTVSLKGAEISCSPDEDVGIRSATIGKHLDFRGSHINCKLDMGHIRISGSLFLPSDGMRAASYQTIVLSNASVGEKVSLEGATISTLDMVRLHVGTNVVFGDKTKIQSAALARRYGVGYL